MLADNDVASDSRYGTTCLFQASGFLFLIIIILFYSLTLQYCIGFAIYQYESATGIHVLPNLNPPPSSLEVFLGRKKHAEYS